MGTSGAKPECSPWSRQCKDSGLKQGALWLLGYQHCCCGPARSTGGQVRTRADVIPEPPLWLSFSTVRKRAGSCCASSWSHRLGAGWVAAHTAALVPQPLCASCCPGMAACSQRPARENKTHRPIFSKRVPRANLEDLTSCRDL